MLKIREEIDRMRKEIKVLEAKISDEIGWAAIHEGRRSNAKDRVKELTAKVRILEQKLDTDREILPADAVHCGQPWTHFETDILEDDLKDLVYEMAKRFGRTTSGIRYRIAYLLAPKIDPHKWHAMTKSRSEEVGVEREPVPIKELRQGVMEDLFAACGSISKAMKGLDLKGL